MLHELLADGVVIVHLTFVAFVVVGGFLCLRWSRLLHLHLASVAWGAGIVLIGWSCPLTHLERQLRSAAGEAASAEGFIERYVEGVLYPGGLTDEARALCAVAIGVSWVLLARRRLVDRRAGPGHPPHVVDLDHSRERTDEVTRG